MSEIDENIIICSDCICHNIEKYDEKDRGRLSQNILGQLRNLVEYIAVKIYSNEKHIDKTKEQYEIIQESIRYIRNYGKFKFLYKFHKLLQISVSHYTFDEENSERLMLKYYEYLIRIKKYLKDKFSMNILENLEAFPTNTDSTLNEYYKKIAEKIEKPSLNISERARNSKYYVHKIKPFFISQNIYYEVTLSDANDHVSKFDRIIAFTKHDISPYYAVNCSIDKDLIHILDKNMPIYVIDNWNVSIRNCELNNLAKIFGINVKINKNQEYNKLMEYLTETSLNLVDIINLNKVDYKKVTDFIKQESERSPICDILDKCRHICVNELKGHNIIRYLLYHLNNKIIKKQYDNKSCSLLSNLYLKNKCIPFDKMPFNTSLANHNPKFIDLLYCIDTKQREHELFARVIKNNTEQDGQLYTSKKDLAPIQNINTLVKKWNSSLYWKHKGRKLEEYKEFLYFKQYEEDSVNIVKAIKNLTSKGIRNYSNTVEDWLTKGYCIDCEEKKMAIKKLFEDSKVALIYGAAGTGKSTMIKHLSNFFHDKNKVFLANTNPAVDNLKHKISAKNSTFSTIHKYLSKPNNCCDILFIDECSTVNNSDMIKILKNVSFKLLVLVGDIYQIESILFGNWFNIIQKFIPKSCITELTKPYRNNNKNLLNLWNRVRELEDNILECMTKNHYTSILDNSIFENSTDDEIILCLNYDGLYGINNINRFLQSNNKNIPVEWGTNIYKINDPIIFNETDRFSPIIYNNLKGRINDIQIKDNQIVFTIDIDKSINSLDAENYNFEFIDNVKNGQSRIRFTVNKYENIDDDNDDNESIVPFQVAYAISIHKAQGLEYNSVKIIITNELDEMVTHNIFYTAITRTRDKLKIYWTPESENKILKSFNKTSNKRDIGLLKGKYFSN